MVAHTLHPVAVPNLAHNHHFSSSNCQIFTQLFLGPLGTVSRSLTKKTIVQEAEREEENSQRNYLKAPPVPRCAAENKIETDITVQGDPQLLPQSFPTNYTSQKESNP